MSAEHRTSATCLAVVSGSKCDTNTVREGGVTLRMLLDRFPKDTGLEFLFCPGDCLGLFSRWMDDVAESKRSPRGGWLTQTPGARTLEVRCCCQAPATASLVLGCTEGQTSTGWSIGCSRHSEVASLVVGCRSSGTVGQVVLKM